MTAGTSLTSPLSPYLQILEAEISADLRGVINAEDLRDEIRKTLTQEVLRRGRTAIDELSGLLSYVTDVNSVQVQKLEAAALRHLGYVQEILELRRSQRINPNFQLTSGQAD